MPDTKPKAVDRRRFNDTTAASAANRRRRKERLAKELREAGWLAVPPEDAARWRKVDDSPIVGSTRQADK